MPAGFRTDHPGFGNCYLHFGATESNAKSADNAKLAARERATLEFLRDNNLVERIDNPLEAIADIASEARAFHRFIGERLAELAHHDWRYESKSGEELREEVALFERSLERVEKFLVNWARLNIDERLAAITERQADALLVVLGSLLADLSLSTEQRDKADVLVPHYLRQAGATLRRPRAGFSFRTKDDEAVAISVSSALKDDDAS